MKYISLENLEVIESVNDFGEQIIEIRRKLSSVELQEYYAALYKQKTSAEDCLIERTIGTFTFSVENRIQLTRNVARELVSQLKAA